MLLRKDGHRSSVPPLTNFSKLSAYFVRLNTVKICNVQIRNMRKINWTVFFSFYVVLVAKQREYAQNCINMNMLYVRYRYIKSKK
jgi:hypothetical protein